MRADPARSRSDTEEEGLQRRLDASHDLDAKIRLAFEAQHAVTIVREPDLPIDEQTVLPMALSRAGGHQGAPR